MKKIAATCSLIMSVVVFVCALCAGISSLLGKPAIPEIGVPIAIGAFSVCFVSVLVIIFAIIVLKK